MKILNNKKSKTLPSNGTQSNNSCTSKLLFNKEKEQQLKKSLYLRFWVALVLTNIFTFILSQPMTEATIEKEINIAKDERLLKLRINEMTNLVGKDQYVALYSGNNHLTNKAKIVKKLEDNTKSIYLVKISISELNKIAPYKALELDSYPVTNQPKSIGGVYEIEI
ncbi:hypothetical protein DAY19_06700 [Halobacteriovorax vibrionivorans]|uniref:POTRA domain-containing protein n=1 Tax=Halobacteriovorax vibrionivorans TaxID=2152716 RepID=A0ABY0IEJ4_9BACT|nr:MULTISPECIES: hypothetical protein [Halobacteriovorax]RZF21368.1 hypothetical protein DAY19_06700 [Halobacteriovorax vibrionivorans]TGD46155.1 hypothetical protein EP118_13225 [Halobacteriovorax sp. Y22]